MPPRKFDLSIETNVLTAGTTADVVNAILEFLLYQRNQIPFNYPTYKYYVNGWHDDAKDSAPETAKELHLQQQRRLAKQTKDAISAMQKLISQTFETKVVKSVRFLFGATTFTPKEVYKLSIPTDAIKRGHTHAHHRLPHSRISQLLLSLLTKEDLYPIFSTTLNPTNLYLELETAEELVNTIASMSGKMEAALFPKKLNEMPPRCICIDFHLLHILPDNPDGIFLKCCEDLEIFEDNQQFDALLLSNKITDNDFSKKSNSPQSLPEWWEADMFVRGFKEKVQKGINIWNK